MLRIRPSVLGSPFVLVLLLSFLSTPAPGQCPECPVPQGHLAIEPGMAVATYYGCTAETNYVVGVYDTRNPAINAPIDTGTTNGTNVMWVPGLNSTAQGRYNGPGTESCDPNDPNAWTLGNLGTVFGVTLDDVVHPNIYVSATALLYINNPMSQWCPIAAHYGPAGAGGVYRLDGSDGTICTVTSLPSTFDSASLGQIDHVTLDSGIGMLYVSNMDDGIIYAVQDTCGSDFSFTFDHGMDGRPNEGKTMIPDDPTLPLSQFGRRIWGLRFNEVENRLYYAVWNTSHMSGGNDPNPTEDNEIWSVKIDPFSGDFVAGSASREFSIPEHGGFEWPISDIAFECGNRMVISERGSSLTNGGSGVIEIADAHQTRHLEYTGNHLAWVASDPNKYRIGNWTEISGMGGQNSAGGIDFDEDGNLVASGDALHNLETNDPATQSRIYGFAIIPSTGSNAAAPFMLDSYLIDADCENYYHDKWFMYDVDYCRPVSTNCAATCAVENPTILCGSATSSDEFTVTFDVVNNSGFDVTKLVIPGLVGGVSVSPNVIDLATPLPDTGILTGVQLFLNGGNAGDVVCIPVGLLAKDDAGNLFECCGTEVCVELPACCLTISSQGFTVDAGGNITYNFNITNESGEAPVVAEHLFTSILSPSNVTLSTDWFALNGLADGDPPITLTNTIIGAQAGDEVCFQITMHDASLSECCGVVICHTVPGNPVPPCIPELICEPVGDANGDGVSDVLLTWPIPANDECCVGDMVIEVNGALIASVNPFTGTALVDCVDGTYCLVCNDVSGNQTIQACCDVACIPFAPPPPEFLRGDANSDGAFDISDVIGSLGYLFQGHSVPCLVALDSNDDETVDIGDTIFSLEALFGGGPSPWPPYQQCGVDETSGNLGCEYFPACEGNDSSPNGG